MLSAGSKESKIRITSEVRVIMIWSNDHPTAATLHVENPSLPPNENRPRKVGIILDIFLKKIKVYLF